MTRVYIGLGSNLGESALLLELVAQELAEHPQIQDLTLSSLYCSAPVDANGPDYINAVARINTGLSPLALLDLLQATELHYGRTRPYPNAPRTLDLDLLLYGEQHINDARLQVPHPRLHQRAFVLYPLSELNPELRLEQGQLQTLISTCSEQRISKFKQASLR